MAIVAIDIGGSLIKYAAISENGDIYYKHSVPTPKTSYEEMIAALLSILKAIESEGYAVDGIALSIPAPVDVSTGIIQGEGSLPFLYKKSIKGSLMDATTLRVTCENDGNCAALAELWKGAATGFSNVVLVVCGTGIGGAIIHDGKIHHGKHLFAGEFGYGIHHLPRDGESIEIWSLAASMGALTQKTAQRLNLSVDSITGADVFKMAEKGNVVAQEEIRLFYRGMAVGIHNIQYYYDPELILIGGGISSREDFIACIKQQLDWIYDQLGHPLAVPDIRICQFQNDANLIGAVKHYLDEDK